MKKLRIGTRGSLLARTQSGWAAERLRELHPGLETELIIIQTSGDRFTIEASAGKEPPSPSPGDAPNVKAMFVKEIEEAILRGDIDCAIHSSKDMPADLPEGLAIGAYPKRELPFDIFIGRDDIRDWKELPPGSRIGTASSRRQLQLKSIRPDIEFAVVRGNVDTRLRKLKAGEVDGMILAAAGLRRLGKAAVVPHQVLGADIIVPAPGQGALAIEFAQKRDDVGPILAAFDDPDTRLEVELERGFMRVVGGGCDMPLGALARCGGEEVSMLVFWSDLEGKRPVRVSGRRPKGPGAASMIAELRKLLEEKAGKNT